MECRYRQNSVSNTVTTNLLIALCNKLLFLEQHWLLAAPCTKYDVVKGRWYLSPGVSLWWCFFALSVIFSPSSWKQEKNDGTILVFVLVST